MKNTAVIGQWDEKHIAALERFYAAETTAQEKEAYEDMCCLSGAYEAYDPESGCDEEQAEYEWSGMLYRFWYQNQPHLDDIYDLYSLGQ